MTSPQPEQPRSTAAPQPLDDLSLMPRPLPDRTAAQRIAALDPWEISAHREAWHEAVAPFAGLGFSVALIVDGPHAHHAGMPATVPALKEALESAHVFEFVTTANLLPDADGQLHVRTADGRAIDPSASLRSHCGFDEKTIVMVVSDCIRGTEAPALLERLGQSHPTALLQLLPESDWPLTELRKFAFGPVRAPAVGVCTARLVRTDPVPGELSWNDDQHAISAPVLIPRPAAVRRWADMLTSPGAQCEALMRYTGQSSRAVVSKATPAQLSPEQLVRRFFAAEGVVLQEFAKLLAFTTLTPEGFAWAGDQLSGSISLGRSIGKILTSGLVSLDNPATVNPLLDSFEGLPGVHFNLKSGVQTVLLSRIPIPRTIDLAVHTDRHMADRGLGFVDFERLIWGSDYHGVDLPLGPTDPRRGIMDLLAYSCIGRSREHLNSSTQ